MECRRGPGTSLTRWFAITTSLPVSHISHNIFGTCLKHTTGHNFWGCFWGRQRTNLGWGLSVVIYHFRKMRAAKMVFVNFLGKHKFGGESCPQTIWWLRAWPA